MTRGQAILILVSWGAALLGVGLFTTKAIAEPAPLCSVDPTESQCAPDPEDRICIDTYYDFYPFSFGDYWGWNGEEDPSDFYCSFPYMASRFEMHIERIRITESMGFGFTMDHPSGLAPGETNAVYSTFHEAPRSSVIKANVDGVELEMQMGTICDFTLSPECHHFVASIDLISGWVTDNGLDFSGRTLTLTNTAFPGPITGFGWTGVPRLFFPEPYMPGAPFEFSAFQIAQTGPISTQLESFFGITFHVDFEPVTYGSAVPEPGTNLMMGFGLMGLVGLFRMRRRELAYVSHAED